MSYVEEHWRNASDEEVCATAKNLHECGASARPFIIAEAKRRKLMSALELDCAIDTALLHDAIKVFGQADFRLGLHLKQVVGKLVSTEDRRTDEIVNIIKDASPVVHKHATKRRFLLMNRAGDPVVEDNTWLCADISKAYAAVLCSGNLELAKRLSPFLESYFDDETSTVQRALIAIERTVSAGHVALAERILSLLQQHARTRKRLKNNITDLIQWSYAVMPLDPTRVEAVCSFIESFRSQFFLRFGLWRCLRICSKTRSRRAGDDLVLAYCSRRTGVH
jgi:rubrerythrin